MFIGTTSADIDILIISPYMKQLVIDWGDRDNGTDACTLNGSADKLGLADAVGRKAGGKVRVFFLGHAGFDNTAAVRRVVLSAWHWLHLLSLIAVFGANLHPVSGSDSQGFSKAESSLLYNFCLFRLPDVLGTRFTLHARNLLMRPFIGWSATVVITLGRSRMGSSCPLLSSPTGNDPAFPKLALLAHSHAGGLALCCSKPPFTLQRTFSRQKAGCVFVNIL